MGAADGRTSGAYDETGPVLIHPTECPGPEGTGFPGRTGLRAPGSAPIRRAADTRGGPLATATAMADPAPAESVLAEVLADPAVAVVHVRAVEYGCFAFEARRA